MQTSVDETDCSGVFICVGCTKTVESCMSKANIYQYCSNERVQVKNLWISVTMHCEFESHRLKSGIWPNIVIIGTPVVKGL